MKEDSFNFSLSDFLAYLFPGTISLIAFAGIIKLSPFQPFITNIQLNLVTGLFLIALAYFTGIIISSITYNFEEKLYRLYKLKSPLDTIQLEGFEEAVLKAFHEIFKRQDSWSRSHFYVSRSLVREKMPNSISVSDRQNSLRQIRRNSIIPILLLGVFGLSAGLKIIEFNNIQNAMNLWGAGLVLASILGSFIAIRNLIKIGMYNNRMREVREVCSSLLVYYYQMFPEDKSKAAS